jgi:hypothetical protein
MGGELEEEGRPAEESSSGRFDTVDGRPVAGICPASSQGFASPWMEAERESRRHREQGRGGRPGSTADRKRGGRCARDRRPPSSRWLAHLAPSQGSSAGGRAFDGVGELHPWRRSTRACRGRREPRPWVPPLGPRPATPAGSAPASPLSRTEHTWMVAIRRGRRGRPPRYRAQGSLRCPLHAWLVGEDSGGGSSTSCWTEGNLVLFINTEPASGPQAAADVEKGKLVGVEEL